jgi:short subunit fatty acids transporter
MFEISLESLPFNVFANVIVSERSYSWTERWQNVAKPFYGTYYCIGSKLVFRDEACYNMFLLRWS